MIILKIQAVSEFYFRFIMFPGLLNENVIIIKRYINKKNGRIR